MTIAPGTQLGPYEVLAPLGQGGMGEVYRARDRRLDRTVAIKILPADVALEPESRQRLHVEARTVSSLNHPHICALFDIGSQDGVDFLVMELLQGETLAERLQRGPMPYPQLLRTAIEIGQALDAAHAHGVVHRDLKPSNVMLTRTGAKLLDFGVAKIRRPAAQAGAETRPFDTLTADGAVLGTLQYMAPEQIDGDEVDARADIFSLGAVVFEMATGRKAFQGKSQASLTAAILEREPAPPSSLVSGIPSSFDRLVARALAKDPEERWQSARDFVFHLEELIGVKDVEEKPDLKPGSRVAWLVAGMATAVAAGAILAVARQPDAPVTAGTFQMSLPQGVILRPPEAASSLALSPDGSRLAFAAMLDGRNGLWLRPLASADARLLAGTEGARLPFWSPDGRFIGFFANGVLKRIDPAGGPPQVICEAPVETTPTWGPDGTILFAMAPDAASQLLGGIYRVPVEGGSIVPVTRIDPSRGESEHYWPSFLPDGEHFLFLATIATPDGANRRHTAYVGSIADPIVTRIDDIESRLLYTRPGHVVYAQDGSLLARPFDLETHQLAGDPVQIAKRLWYFQPTGMAQFAASDNGVVAYHGDVSLSELVWLDRTGRQLATLGGAGSFSDVKISRDGKRIAVTAVEGRTGSSDIWIYDRTSGIPTRFTSDPVEASSPVWSTDGQTIFFRSVGVKSGPPDIFQKRSDGRGAKELRLAQDGVQSPLDASADGHLLYSDANRRTGRDLWLLPLAGSSAPRPYLRTIAFELDARFSPNGRWIAFVSSESGTGEVYVGPVDDPGASRRVSAAGGVGPRWRRDGRELVYLDPSDTFMSVGIRESQNLSAEPPKRLFSSGRVFKNPGGGFGGEPYYDLAPDGESFLVNQIITDPSIAPITLVINWPALHSR
jgi:Tol biopolymer transport system component